MSELLVASSLSSSSSLESYQVNPKFPPNKESTWSSYPIEVDSLILTNNSVRGELSCLKQAVDIVLQQQQQQQQQQQPENAKTCHIFPDWQISALQRMCTSHFIHMDSDYRKEEDRLKPRLLQRFRIPESTALDYTSIQQHLTNLKSRIIGELGTTSDTDQRRIILSAVQEELIAYEANVRCYMLEREKLILPLIRAYFSCSEWSKVLRDVFSNDPAQSTGSLIHFQTEHGFRTGFMKREGIPSFVWYIAFRGLYNTFRKEFVQPYETIVNKNILTSS